MTIGLLTASYITSSVLFILALGGLSNQEKAKRAVWYGIVGMEIAVFATIYGNQVFSTDWLNWLIAAILVGSIIGAIVAKKVQMTGMPQLVAALHSFVGLAAVFIGINSADIKNYNQINNKFEVKVDFVSEIISCVKDRDQKLISGSPEKIKKVYDTWKFSRNVKSINPNWLLVDTQA